MPGIFEQTPCHNKMGNTFNIRFHHKDIGINFFMIRKQNPRKKSNQNKNRQFSKREVMIHRRV